MENSNSYSGGCYIGESLKRLLLSLHDNTEETLYSLLKFHVA